jgi:hypothetical protein
LHKSYRSTTERDPFALARVGRLAGARAPLGFASLKAHNALQRHTPRPMTTSAVLGSAAAAVVAFNGCVIFSQHIFQNLSVIAFDYVQDKPLWTMYNYCGWFTLLVVFGIIFCE